MTDVDPNNTPEGDVRVVIPDADTPIGVVELTPRNYGPIELVSVDPAWRPHPPTLEPPQSKPRCKHPVSFMEWREDGRWCLCGVRVAPPR